LWCVDHERYEIDDNEENDVVMCKAPSVDYEWCCDHHRYEIRSTHSPVSEDDLVLIEKAHENFRFNYLVDVEVGL